MNNGMSEWKNPHRMDTHLHDRSHAADSSIFHFISPSTEDESSLVIEELGLLMRQKVLHFKSRYNKCKAFYKWRLRSVAPQYDATHYATRDLDPGERQALVERLSQAANLAYLDLHHKLKPVSKSTVDDATGIAYMFQVVKRLQLRRSFERIRRHANSNASLETALAKLSRTRASNVKMVVCRGFFKWVSFTNCYDQMRLEDLVQSQKKRLMEQAENIRQKDILLLSLKTGEKQIRVENQQIVNHQRQATLVRWVAHRRISSMKSAYSCWVKSISCWAVAERASARGRALWMMLKVLRTQNQGVLRTLFRI